MELYWMIREHAWREAGRRLVALALCAAAIVLLALAVLSVTPGEPAPKPAKSMCDDVSGVRDNLVLDECAAAHER